ncbi:MAG: hypothetical protein L0287_22975 [Anaerolineae bacterium]|nr:hypothetical protein [Anaerolineae bacterium]MCI0610936.1 hypothetical protein [Anaerolineae bacterium]
MRSNRTWLFWILGGVILLCGCAAVFLYLSQSLGGSAPPPVGATEEPAAVEPTQPLPMPTLPSVSATEQISAFTPQPAINESRRLTLEFPPTMRAGDSDIVRLTLEVDDLGNITPTAQFEEHVVTGGIVQIPNLYESHHVIAESRFDIAGVEISPTELISMPLAQGQSATFSWSIRPPDVGVYRGTIWLYLRFVDKLNGEESQITVSAQIVEIEAVNLLGLSGSFARTTGLIGSVIGTIIGIPFFEDILKYLFKRRKKK